MNPTTLEAINNSLPRWASPWLLNKSDEYIAFAERNLKHGFVGIAMNHFNVAMAYRRSAFSVAKA